MAKIEEWEKSIRLNDILRRNIRIACLKFGFTEMHNVFVAIIRELGEDLYKHNVDKKLQKIYREIPEQIDKIVVSTCKFTIDGLNRLPDIPNGTTSSCNSGAIQFLKEKPDFKNTNNLLKLPKFPRNKEARKLITRYLQLNKDIDLFKERINTFLSTINTALNNSQSTGMFIKRNPEFEGYMKQSLKKFYEEEHPDVISTLNNALDVRVYASITNGYRLQAYQKAMLSQLQKLAPPVSVSQCET